MTCFKEQDLKKKYQLEEEPDEAITPLTGGAIGAVLGATLTILLGIHK